MIIASENEICHPSPSSMAPADPRHRCVLPRDGGFGFAGFGAGKGASSSGKYGAEISEKAEKRGRSY